MATKVKKMYVGVDDKASLLLDFDNIGKKASINGVNVQGDLTSSDLNIPEVVTISYEDYLKLSNAERNGGKTYYIPDAPSLGQNLDSSNIYYDKTESGLSSTNVQDAIDEVKEAIDTKQDALTFDTTPTDNSTNPVTSGGIKAALDAKKGNVEGYLNATDGKFYEEDTYETEIAGVSGMIYVDLSTNKIYRAESTGFIEISSGTTLGETSDTAYAGDKGKANADAIDAINDDLKSAIPHTADISLSPSNWTDNLQIVAVDDMTDRSIVFSAPSADVLKDYKKCGVKLQEQKESALIYSCSTTPLIALPLHIVHFWRPWTPSFDANGNEVKYAVQLYGIKEDDVIDSSGSAAIAGLTFGPALGLTPSQTGISHNPTGTTAKGNAKRCIHDDDWATIKYWSEEDPYVYEDCIANGCTHSVKLNLNDTIKGDTLTGFATNSDGSGVLYSNLAYVYTRWNPTSNIDTSNASDDWGSNKFGWSGSKIRATLNGADEYTKSEVAIGIDTADQTLLASNNCLLSCFDPEIKNIIVPKVIVGDKDGDNTSEALSTTYDKLWLFSTKEIGFGGANAANSNVKNYSGHNGAEYTEKLNAWGISDVDVGSVSTISNRIGYREDGRTHCVWLRSPHSLVASDVWYVITNGGSGNYIPRYLSAVAPGFCVGSHWAPSKDANGNEVKYAVQLYGIREDTVRVNGADATAGLTFGPALGLTPEQTGVSHVPSGTSTGGNPMRCIHNDDWETIAYWSKTDPTVYADCITNGCTHSVRLNLNDTIKGDSLTGFDENSDGSGVLFSNIADAYKRWNPTSNVDTSESSNSYGSNKYGWSGSKIRATLNGSDSSTKSSVASGKDAADQTILTSSNCLLSCFDPAIRDVIAPKVIAGDKDYSSYNTSAALSTTYDKLWLFSTKEIGFGGANAANSNVKNYSGHNGAEYTEKLNAWGISDVDEGSVSANTSRIGYYEDGTAKIVWLRSPYSSNALRVWDVGTDGSNYYDRAYYPYAVAPGFCLP